MDQIGKYAIVGKIGTGGFGVVYEGRDPFLKRRVAIKTCSSEEPEIRDRFFREAEIAGNLQHRNIVTVHDFGIQDGVPYLVQEYLTGEDLDRVVARREPLPPAQRVDILAQAARGLEYAHQQGVIHRDVKPANIRITADGTVKIMDFGIAKLSNVASHLTRTGMTLGTAAYLPPEQIRGTAVDHRADVFSFGVTAYELLTYRRPFAGKTISALFWELLQREPEPLVNHWPSCPPALEQVVLRCLAKDPQQRYADFGELIPALEAVLADLRRPGRGEDLTAPHPSPAPAASVEPSAPPRPAAAWQPPTLAGPGAAAVRAAAPTPPGPAKGSDAAAPPPAPPRGRSPNERFEAALTAARRIQPAATGSLLGEVEEALAGAGAAAPARRARELLARGELEAAERELAAVPAKAGPEVAAVRRDLARARADRSLAQAAAKWQQGEPQAALAMIDQLLALAPDHQDALRLRDSWRAELAERDRVRAAAAEEATARRVAIGATVAEAEELLVRGDLDGAEAVVAAAQAHLGSHQPLRDLRRRISAARSSAPTVPAASVGGGRVSVDASTVGVAGLSVAAARQRIDAAALRSGGGAPGAPAGSSAGGGSVSPPGVAGAEPAARPAPTSGVAWPRPDVRTPTPARTPPSYGSTPLSAAAGEGATRASAARTRVLLLVVGGVILLLILALLARWLWSRSAGTAASAPTPTPAATASAAVSPVGVGVQPSAGASARPLPADREATLVRQAATAFPTGVPRQNATVRIEVFVDANGKPLETRIPAGVVAHPRLVAEARRAASQSEYLPALRGGVPAESWLLVDVRFRLPS